MTQYRPPSSMIAAVAAAAALGLPGMASAAYEHRPTTKRASSFIRSTSRAGRRAQVIEETKAAMQRGRLSYGQSNFPIRTPDVGSSKTREQVINELLGIAWRTRRTSAPLSPG